MLVREVKVLLEMKKVPGFPYLYSYGKDDHYNYFIMSFLGRNLENLNRKCGGKFSLPTICNIAI